MSYYFQGLNFFFLEIQCTLFVIIASHICWSYKNILLFRKIKQLKLIIIISHNFICIHGCSSFFYTKNLINYENDSFFIIYVNDLKFTTKVVKSKSLAQPTYHVSKQKKKHF